MRNYFFKRDEYIKLDDNGESLNLKSISVIYIKKKEKQVLIIKSIQKSCILIYVIIYMNYIDFIIEH